MMMRLVLVWGYSLVVFKVFINFNTFSILSSSNNVFNVYNFLSFLFAISLCYSISSTSYAITSKKKELFKRLDLRPLPIIRV